MNGQPDILIITMGVSGKNKPVIRERLYPLYRRVILLNFAGFSFERGVGSAEAGNVFRHWESSLTCTSSLFSSLCN